MEAVNYFLVINFIFAISGHCSEEALQKQLHKLEAGGFQTQLTVLLVVDAECEACFWPSCLHKTHKPTLRTYTHIP